MGPPHLPSSGGRRLRCAQLAVLLAMGVTSIELSARGVAGAAPPPGGVLSGPNQGRIGVSATFTGAPCPDPGSGSPVTVAFSQDGLDIGPFDLTGIPVQVVPGEPWQVAVDLWADPGVREVELAATCVAVVEGVPVTIQTYEPFSFTFVGPTPTLSLLPPIGYPGERLTVTDGGGCDPGQQAHLTDTDLIIDGSDPMKPATDPNGRWGPIAVTVPPEAAIGDAFSIGAFCQDDLSTWTYAGAVFTVATPPSQERVHLQASVAIPQSLVRPGDAITLRGDSFAQGPAVAIALKMQGSLADPLVLGTTRADHTGSFEAVVTIPGDALAGTYEISASQLVSAAGAPNGVTTTIHGSTQLTVIESREVVVLTRLPGTTLADTGRPIARHLKIAVTMLAAGVLATALSTFSGPPTSAGGRRAS